MIRWTSGTSGVTPVNSTLIVSEAANALKAQVSMAMGHAQFIKGSGIYGTCL